MTLYRVMTCPNILFQKEIDHIKDNWKNTLFYCLNFFLEYKYKKKKKEDTDVLGAATTYPSSTSAQHFQL